MSDDMFDSIWADRDAKRCRYYNGYQWEESTSGKTVDVISPIDGHMVGTVQQVSQEEVNAIVHAAHQAQPAWEERPLSERMAVFHTSAELLREHHETLTKLLTEEIGKSYEESKSEVLRTADLIDFTAKEAQSITGEEIDGELFPNTPKGKHCIVSHVAQGVVLAIAPFNYPINLAASKIAPGLLMGNAVIFKPPTQGSVVGLYLTEIFVKAGLPPHLLSCITGAGREIGDILVTHPGISMIAFTGSTEVGTAIAGKAGMKPLLFECGGNNPAFVLPDADGDLVAKELVKGAFSYAGQRCTALKYVLATEEVLNILFAKVEEEMKKQIHMGDPRSEETKLVGPLISEKAAEVVIGAIDDAVKEGAKVVTGGKRNGTYAEPTVLTNVKPSMRVVREETFGPVLSFVPVSSMDEGVAIVNASRYGLQASVFTQDEGTGIALAKKIMVGTVQMNGLTQRGPDHFPFMGIKGSGLGVQGVKYSLLAMSRLKSVVTSHNEIRHF